MRVSPKTLPLENDRDREREKERSVTASLGELLIMREFK